MEIDVCFINREESGRLESQRNIIMVNYDSQLKHYNCGEIVGNIVKKKL